MIGGSGRRTTLLLGLTGLAGAVALLHSLDSAAIGRALGLIGGGGAIALTAYRLLSVILCALAWRVLRPGGPAPSFLAARLARDGVASLLPMLPAGGEVVGARMLALEGEPPAAAAAATIGDLTLEVASQAAFTLIGAAALTAALPGDHGRWAWAALAASLPLLAGLGLIQHPRMLALLEGLAGRLAKGAFWADWLGERGLAGALARLRRRPARLLAGFLIHLAAWLVGTGEAWLALRLMGAPLGLTTVLALEAVVFALRGAAFAIPWAAGVQEGSYLALGLALGLPAEIALALSLVKRLPDLALGLVGLALWQRRERQAARAAIAAAE